MQTNAINNLSGSMAIGTRVRCLTRYAWISVTLINTLFAALISEAQNLCTPSPVGIVDWWPGDGFAFDVVGTNDGSLQNGAVYAIGEVGQGFVFNATNAYVSLPTNFFPFPFSGNANNPFTFEVWFSTTVGGVIFGQQNGPANGLASSFVPGLYVGTDGKLRAEMFWNGSVNPITSATSVTDGVFHHAAVTYNGTFSSLFLDGVEIGTMVQTQAGYASTYFYQFGTGNTSGWPGGNGGWYQFIGVIDEPALYSRALGSGEIAAIYAAGNSGKCYTNTSVPVFVRQPTNQTNYTGMSAVLSAPAMGTPRPRYQWYRGTNLISGANAPNLVMTRLDATDAGSYNVIVSSSAGASTSQVAMVQVVQPDPGWRYPQSDWTSTLSYPASTANRDGGVLQVIASPAVPGTGAISVLSGDVTGDGNLKIVCVRGTNVSIFTTNYTLINQFTINLGAMAGINRVILEDISGAGSQQIVVGFSPNNNNDQDYIVNAYSASGALVRQFSLGNSSDGYGMFPLYKVGGQMIMGNSAGYSVNPRGFSAWDCTTGSNIWQYAVACAAYPNIQSLGDLYSDGNIEFAWNNSTVHNGANVNDTTDSSDYTVIVDQFGQNHLTQIYQGNANTNGSISDYFIRFQKSSPGQLLTMKIYDPLYYPGTSMLHLRNAYGTILDSISGLPNAQWDLGVCDLDSDGALELVLNNYNSSNNIQSVIREDFSIQYQASESGRLIAVSDVAGNGRPQIFMTSGNQLKVLDGHLNKIYQQSFGGTISGAIVGDINKNGSSEVIVAADKLYVCELSPQPVTLANPETFDSGLPGWWTDNAAVWQIGPPTSGPPLNPNSGSRAYSAPNVAATGLTGNYSPNSVGRLVSPPFIVPAGNPGDLSVLRFWQWYQLGTGDSGLVQVSQWDGSSWLPWQTLSVAATNGSSAAWQQQTVDVTAYQGQRLRLGFLQSANSDASVGAGWFLDNIGLSSLVPTTIALGQSLTNSFATNSQSQYFVLQVPPGGSLQFTLNGSGANQVYVSRGVLPTPGSYDYHFQGNATSNLTVFVPNAGAGPWYVLVFDAGGDPETYTLTTQFLTGIILSSVSPASLGNSTAGTVAISGAGFAPDDTVTLVNGGNVYQASAVSVISASQIQADFDFKLIPANSYSLQVAGGTNLASIPFTVTGGGAAALQTSLIVPNPIGYHIPSTLYVQYANTGQVAMPAPLLTVSATQVSTGFPSGRSAALLTLNASLQGLGYWTPALPQGFANTVQFLASGSVPGLLQPGESATIPIYYAGWQQPWDFNYDPIQFNLGILTVTNTMPVNWPSLEAQMQPPTISNEVWNVLFSNFTNQTGTTWGQYVQMLDNDSGYLYRLGDNVSDVSALLTFEFAKANALNIVRNLATASDVYVPTPGLPLRFSRVFPQSISRRYAQSALGYGWSHNWDISLSIANDIQTNTTAPGTITVAGPAGSQRVFQPDSRGGYFSQAGDHGVLASLGGGRYSLTETHGLVTFFRSNQLDYIQDPNGNTVAATWSGNLLMSLTNSSGQNLQFTYIGNLIQTVADSVGRTTTFSYDSAGHLTNATYFDGSQVGYAYSIGNGATKEHALTQITSPTTNHQYFAYDNQGRLSNLSLDGGAQSLSFSYDSGGTVFVTDANSHSTVFSLDNNGLLAKAQNPATNSVSFAYDANFNLTAFTDPTGRSYNYSYDGNGNLTKFTDALGRAATLTYQGTFNRLATLLDANANLTTYGTDNKGDLRSISYADSSSEKWGYDTVGDPVTWTNRRGQVITFQFNGNGQPLLKMYPDGRTINYSYNNHALLTNVVDSIQGITRILYDVRDNVTNITYPDGNGFIFTYDAAGRRTSRVGFDGYALNYNYDAVGRLATLTDGSNNQLVQYTYDANGRLNTETKGNGTFTFYNYNAAGQLVALTNAAPGGAVQSFFNYSYDAKGNRLAMTNASGVTIFAYDDLNQLTGVNYPSGRNVTYAYDALGNRTTVNDSGTNTTYTANSLNEYSQAGGTVYSYDADGNMTNQMNAAGTTTFQYDAENRLVSVLTPTNDTWQYVYDALGNRSATVRNGATNHFLLDPFGLADVAAEYDSNGNLLARYNHGLGLVARVDNGGSAAFYSFDALGNTRQMTGNAGSILNSYDYDAFGATTSATESISNAYRFIGRFGVAGEQAGIHFMRARYYTASIGRFISTDPLKLGGKDINLYKYARNSPTSFIDPAGTYSSSDAIWSNIALYYTRYYWQMWLRGAMTQTEGWFIQNQRLINEGSDFLKGLLEQFTDAPLEASTEIPETLSGWGWLGVPVGIVAGNYIYDILNPNDHGPWITNPWEEIPLPTPPPSSTTTSSVMPVSSHDPNSLTGPNGFGMQNFLVESGLFGYEIFFENATNATAPAQIVQINDPLSTNLDWTTFQLTEIDFGNTYIAIPPGSQLYANTFHLTQSNFNFDVQITAGMNPYNGVVYANFFSVNPTNGLPPPAGIGFLPPENGTGRGMGHILYTVRPKQNLPTGTQITNIAYIQFDQNPVIATDQFDTNDLALITIDSTPPVSSVSALPATETNIIFTVCWSGTDVGSGIASYDIYVSTNNGPWVLWLGGATNLCATFFGQDGRNYGFYSIAHDGAGNIQPTPAGAQATTSTLSNYPPLIDPVANQFVVVGQQLIVTNHAQDPDLDYPISFSLDSTAPAGAAISIDGVLTWTPTCPQGSTTNLIRIWATDSGTPLASNSMSFTVTVSDCVQVSIGSTEVQTGQIGSVPVNLLSTVALTNMSFALQFPPNKFTNWTFASNNPAIGTTFIQSLNPSNTLFTFSIKPGQVLQGPAFIGQAGFTAMQGHSAFVPLQVVSIQGTESNSLPAGNVFGIPGRIVVVGPEPLLEAWLSTNSQRMLTLYGNPGASYELAKSTDRLTTNWVPLQRIPMTNLSEYFTADQTNPSVFYRAWQFTANPPILELNSLTRTNLGLLMYGVPGSNYTLLSGTSFSSISNWSPTAGFVLTNSFQFINAGPTSNLMQFFRARQP